MGGGAGRVMVELKGEKDGMGFDCFGANGISNQQSQEMHGDKQFSSSHQHHKRLHYQEARGDQLCRWLGIRGRRGRRRYFSSKE